MLYTDGSINIEASAHVNAKVAAISLIVASCVLLGVLLERRRPGWDTPADPTS
jgi:hypothetical protein